MKKHTRLYTLFLLLFVLLTTGAAHAGEAGTATVYMLELPIQTAYDDMEEWAVNGVADADSRDLELGCEDPGGDDTRAQIVGLRFADLPLIRGAVITEAYIQFTVDQVKYPADPFAVTIAIEDAADAAPFAAEGEGVAQYALSSRAVLAQGVRWATGEDDKIVWRTKGKAGQAQRTPDLSALVQPVIDREDWAYGNAVAFLISGVGNRTAVAFERSKDKAPVLHLSFLVINEAQPTPQGLYGTAPTTLFEDDGVLWGTTADMEYRRAGDDAAKWTACGDGSVAGLASGIYEVRYAEKTCYNAGETARVILPLYAAGLTLQPGTDETEMNFTWYLRDSKAEEGFVQLAPAAAMTDGGFPGDDARTFTGEADWIKGGDRSNKVTVTGLAPDTDYVYRVGNGEIWSDMFRFATRDAANYSMILVGDPQVGASGDTEADTRGWQATVTRALTTFPDASFFLSAGDQVQAATSEKQYEGFFAPADLRSVPLVPTIGNHDGSELFPLHFNPPNQSRYGRTIAGYDYWFTYGNVLYMVLNTNNRTVEEHDKFMQQAIEAAGGEIVWRVAVFHHAIYSSANHSIEIGIVSLRKLLYPLMDKYEIDVAFTGHDHCYTRSYQMLGDEAQNELESVAVNPAGTLYITCGSASGSMYYGLQKDSDIPYRATRWPVEEPSYSCVTLSDSALSIETFLTATNERIDRYMIIKDPNAPASLTGAAPSAAGAADGSIAGTTAAMEYRKTSNAAWTACGDPETTGLAPGTYAVRFRATAQREASAAVTVNVPGAFAEPAEAE